MLKKLKTHIETELSLINQAYKIEKSDITTLIFYLVVFSFFVFPIVFANEYYRDDLHRIITGTFGWNSMGRPLADIGLTFLSGSLNRVLIDTAPLTQIVCIALMAMSALYMFKHLNYQYDVKIPLVSCLPFLSPFLLTNLSYRYDSFGMMLGVLLVAMAFFVPTKSKWPHYRAIALLFLALTCYQPMANLFIGLVAIELLFDFSRFKRIEHSLMLCGKRAGEFVMAYLIYFLTIGQTATTHRKQLISFDGQFFEHLYENMVAFVTLASVAYNNHLGHGALMIILFFGAMSVAIITAKERLQAFKWGIVISLVAVTGLVSLFGPMLMLSESLVDYRLVPSASILFPIVISLSVIVWKRFEWLALLPLLFSLSVAFQYGNVIKNQRNFEREVVNQASLFIHENGLFEKELYSFGKIQYAPWVRISVDSSPIIKALLDRNVAENWILTGLLRQQGVQGAVWLWSKQRQDIEAKLKSELCEKSKEIMSTTYFKLFESERNLFLVMEPASHSRELCSVVSLAQK